MMASLSLLEMGMPVRLVSYHPPQFSNSVKNRSGFCVAANPKEPSDSPEKHFEETLQYGEYLANQSLVREMCYKAPEILNLLSRLGIVFHQTPEGNPDFRTSEGTRFFRLVTMPVSFGRRLLYLLDGQLKRYEKEGLLARHEGLELASTLLNAKGALCGVSFINKKTLSVEALPADAVVLCTGGYGGIFSNSVSSSFTCGGAMGVFYRSGACLANPEMIQFAPAASFGGDQIFSIVNAMLSCGARYRIIGESFSSYPLEEKYPLWKNRVAYDEVVKLMVDRPSHFYLDLTHRPKSVVLARLSEIEDLVHQFGKTSLTKNPVPLNISVLCSLGGLWVDENLMSNVPGLFAAGNCQYQYHGASLLEGNMILASLVSGIKSATQAVYYTSGLEQENISQKILEEEIKKQEGINRDLVVLSGAETINHLFEELRNQLFHGLGPVRSEKDLIGLEKFIVQMRERASHIHLSDVSRFLNEELLNARRFNSALDIAHAAVKAALYRKESRGSHHRVDYPKRNDETFLKTSKVVYSSSGPQIAYEDVDTHLVAPKERKYC